MGVLHLPYDPFSGKPAPDNSIILHPFTATRNTLKAKAILDRNAISLVLTGEKTMRFTEKTVYVNDKEIHFLSAGHCIASMDISKKKPFKSILIFFDNKELTDFFHIHAAFIKKAMVQAPVKPDAYIAFKKDAFITHYIESIQLMLNSGGSLSLSMKRLKLHELLLYLLEHHTQLFLSFKYKGNVPPAELTIRNVVESNLLSNLTIEEMAFLCNLSTSTFKRHFRNIYGESPNTWILTQKMQLAAHLLIEKKERPAEIWFKLGFETHSGFTKSFKKHFGVTPKGYIAGLTFQD